MGDGDAPQPPGDAVGIAQATCVRPGEAEASPKPSPSQSGYQVSGDAPLSTTPSQSSSVPSQVSVAPGFRPGVLSSQSPPSATQDPPGGVQRTSNTVVTP
jgi:hypothetical protein